MAMKNSKVIWLAKGETQSLRGDSALQFTPEWETMHFVLTNSVLGVAEIQNSNYRTHF